MPETKSTCCYCGVGCGVIIGTEGGRITSMRGDPDHPANYGRLCINQSAAAFSANRRVTSAAATNISDLR